MAKVTIAEWYDRTNGAWPAQVPPLEDKEAEHAVRRLFRFATGRRLTMPIKITSGRRYTWARNGIFYVNPSKGWKSLVHLVSHYIHTRERPWARPHARSHARLELKLVKEVLRRGWLEGKLRPRPAPAPVPPTKDEKRERKIETRRAQVKRLDRRIKSLTTRLKTARRSLAALERAARTITIEGDSQ